MAIIDTENLIGEVSFHNFLLFKINQITTRVGIKAKASRRLLPVRYPPINARIDPPLIIKSKGIPQQRTAKSGIQKLVCGSFFIFLL